MDPVPQGKGAPSDSTSEAFHTRSYFYVGGRYENVTSDLYGSGPVLVEQIYVERLTPVSVRHEYPIVFWTGLGQTGANWLNTPDGRTGWASYFLTQGYIVYLADQPQRGRSPWLPTRNETFGLVSSTYAQQYWTATRIYGLWPQARLHTQFPGTGMLGDPTFDAWLAAQVQYRSDQRGTERLSGPALTALFDKIGPAFILTHSQGGPHGWQIGDARPQLVKGIVAIEPQGPPFINAIRGGPGIVRPYGITQTPITYDPPLASVFDLATVTIRSPNPSLSNCILQVSPPRRLANLARVPVLVVTGEAGYHAVFDHCTVEYMKQAGVGVQWLNLPEVGIRGNGHFMFMELNNQVIAQRIGQWMATVEGLSQTTSIGSTDEGG